MNLKYNCSIWYQYEGQSINFAEKWHIPINKYIKAYTLNIISYNTFQEQFLPLLSYKYTKEFMEINKFAILNDYMRLFTENKVV